MSFREKPFFECLKRITWEDLEVHYYPRGTQVRNKLSGKIVEVSYVQIDLDEFDQSYISYVENGRSGTGYEMKLIEVEKVK